jgi:alpha-aminoadipate carrier protein LysW
MILIRNESMANAECPVCGTDVELVSDTEQGELIECGECGSDLEVARSKPYSLIEAPQTEEDWGE